MANAPCKNCPDRHVGCHGQCEKYQQFRVAQTEDNEHRHMLAVSRKSDKSWIEKKAWREMKYGR